MNQCHVFLCRLILPGGARMDPVAWELHVDLLLLGGEVPPSGVPLLVHVALVVPGGTRLPGVLLLEVAHGVRPGVAVPGAGALEGHGVVPCHLWWASASASSTSGLQHIPL